MSARDVPRELPGALAGLLHGIEARAPLGVDEDPGRFVVQADADHPGLYRNRNPRLEIDFTVQRLPLPAMTAFDPRLVRIAPRGRNERHRHAHESLFVVLRGRGEVLVGETWIPCVEGQVAFVPRWIVHQTRNLSETEELVVLAITDFGLTGAVLGDYDRRTRLAAGGEDAG